MSGDQRVAESAFPPDHRAATNAPLPTTLENNENFGRRFQRRTNWFRELAGEPGFSRPPGFPRQVPVSVQALAPSCQSMWHIPATRTVTQFRTAWQGEPRVDLGPGEKPDCRAKVEEPASPGPGRREADDAPVGLSQPGEGS
jgi:hypothetical protein